MVGQVINGKAVLIYTEQVIDEVMDTFPALPLHKSENNQWLAIGGFLARKSMDARIKRLAKQKYIAQKNIC